MKFETIDGSGWTCLMTLPYRAVVTAILLGVYTQEEDAFTIEIFTSEDALRWDIVWSKKIAVAWDAPENVLAELDCVTARFVYIKHNASPGTKILPTISYNPYLIPFKNVTIFYNEQYYTGMLASLYANSYEGRELQQVLNYITDDDVVLELGASIGGVSTVTLKNKKVKRYVCIEANPRLIGVIKRNHHVNNLKAEIHNVIATNELDKEYYNFYIRENFLASSMSDETAYTQSVSVKSVYFPSLLKEISPTFIICDIEGAEFDLFKGVDLASVNYMSIELHYINQQAVDDFFDFMEAQGFELIDGKREFSKQTVCLFGKKHVKKAQDTTAFQQLIRRCRGMFKTLWA